MYQPTTYIPIDNQCVPLLADLIIPDYEARLLMNKDGKVAKAFNSSFLYIDYISSLNKSRFGDCLHLSYPKEVEVKGTTDTQVSASYINMYLEIRNDRRLKTKLVMISLF